MDAPTIAVLGGGQLGRMLGLAAVPLGIRCRFLDPSPDAPAAAVGPLVVGGLGDEGALAEVAGPADVVTYEWEGVPAAAARFLARAVPVRPGARALEVSQDRLVEKSTLAEIGIPVPRFAAVDDETTLRAAVGEIGETALLKTRRGGYDGKGQLRLRPGVDAAMLWTVVGDRPLILEEIVPFDRELSVLAVRALDGTTVCYPLVENRHAEGMLRVSRFPAPRVDIELQRSAEHIATRLLDALDYVGVLAVELFEVGGALVANEIAPRVHNSGHASIEGSETSQFENHVRAVLGWPLGSTASRGPAAMVNCIGAMPDRDAVLAVPGAHLHDYGKKPRKDRKLGHVTITAPADAALDERLARVEAVVAAASAAP